VEVYNGTKKTKIYTNIPSKNKGIISTHLVDNLGTSYGPLVEKH
jgi:hypothetical protein